MFVDPFYSSDLYVSFWIRPDSAPELKSGKKAKQNKIKAKSRTSVYSFHSVNLLLFYFINLFLPHLVLITSQKIKIKCLTKKRKYLFSLRLDFSRYGQLAVLGTILYLSFMHSSKTSERWIIRYLLIRASTWGKEKMDLTYNSYIPYV